MINKKNNSLISTAALLMMGAASAMTHQINVNGMSEPTFHQVALVGETVDIIANENPSTGYTWLFNEIENKTANAVSVVSNEYVSAENANSSESA